MDPIFEIKNGMKTCPYNRNHKVPNRGYRFITHLLKCSKKSGKRFQPCPFNAQHHIVEPMDFYGHLQTCVDRVAMRSEPSKVVVPKVHEDGDEMKEGLTAIADAFRTSSFAKSPKVYAAVYKLLETLRKEGGYEQNVMESPASLPASLINEAAEHLENALKAGVAPYGSKRVVRIGIQAIADAYKATFEFSLRGSDVLEELVATIYEEARIPYIRM